jgi:hypothetical protein
VKGVSLPDTLFVWNHTSIVDILRVHIGSLLMIQVDKRVPAILTPSVMVLGANEADVLVCITVWPHLFFLLSSSLLPMQYNLDPRFNSSRYPPPLTA